MHKIVAQHIKSSQLIDKIKNLEQESKVSIVSIENLKPMVNKSRFHITYLYIASVKDFAAVKTPFKDRHPSLSSKKCINKESYCQSLTIYAILSTKEFKIMIIEQFKHKFIQIIAYYYFFSLKIVFNINIINAILKNFS